MSFSYLDLLSKPIRFISIIIPFTILASCSVSDETNERSENSARSEIPAGHLTDIPPYFIEEEVDFLTVSIEEESELTCEIPVYSSCTVCQKSLEPEIFSETVTESPDLSSGPSSGFFLATRGKILDKIKDGVVCLFKKGGKIFPDAGHVQRAIDKIRKLPFIGALEELLDSCTAVAAKASDIAKLFDHYKDLYRAFNDASSRYRNAVRSGNTDAAQVAYAEMRILKELLTKVQSKIADIGKCGFVDLINEYIDELPKNMPW